MSLLRLPKLRPITSTIKTVRERLTRRGRQSAGRGGYRRLAVDPLEERVLLSVVPSDVGDGLINQDMGDTNYTISAQSLAADHDGDFVVTWTRLDPIFQTDPVTGEPILDPLTGEPLPVIDPLTGQPMTDANIYARYFTDEVQRITLPEAAAADAIPGRYGNFTLRYGGNEVQKLAITATYEPSFAAFGGFFPQMSITATFTLGYDFDGDGDATGAGEETAPIEFYESLTTATTIQDALRSLGDDSDPLEDVVVEPVNPHEYMIRFGDASEGLNVPELVVTDVTFDTGFLPAAEILTVREPVEIGPIFVSPDNPALTALAIEQSFLQTSDNFLIGPIDFPPADRVPPPLGGFEGPRYVPAVMRTALPRVSVTPLSATQFNVRFGADDHTPPNPWLNMSLGADSGKEDHPELVVTSVLGESPLALPLHRPDVGIISPEVSVKTIKEPSPEFRVNPPEPDNPVTALPDVYNQSNPAVAMDADGEFVIVWESEIPSHVNYGSISDVFARRFAPIGLVDDPEFVQGVKVLVSPEAEVVRTLTIDSAAGLPLEGQFRLRIGDNETRDIAVNLSADPVTGAVTGLEALATDIQNLLTDAGYRDAAVTLLSGTDPFQFEIAFDASYGNQAGADSLVVEYVPDAAAPLPATVTVAGETEDPYTFLVNVRDTTNAQGEPAVGMDNAGNFVIAWIGGGQDISFFNDVYAQRFNRHGERLGLDWMVNAVDTAIHFDPYVGMSADGHFAITWTRTEDPNYILNNPYFALVNAEIYNPAGVVLFDQFLPGGAGGATSAFDAANNCIISWAEIDDQDNIGGMSSGVFAQMYELYPAEIQVLTLTPTVPGVSIGGFFRLEAGGVGSRPIPFNSVGSSAVVGEIQEALTALGLKEVRVMVASSPVGQYAYQISFRGAILGEDQPDLVYVPGSLAAAGAVTVTQNARIGDTGSILRDKFRANSASLNPAGEPTVWPNDQMLAQVVIDADGDPLITFDGYGPEVSERVSSSMDFTGTFDAYLNSQIRADDPLTIDVNEARNEDLIEFFDPTWDFLPISFTSSGAVDAVIEDVLIRAIGLGATDAQLGRLRAILDRALTPLRGEANGVMFSRWDADPNLGTLVNLFSDSIANAQRDGHNARYIISIDGMTANGTFTVRLIHPFVAGFEDVVIPVASQNDVLDPVATGDNIAAALAGATRTGTNWPAPLYEGPVSVRWLTPMELVDREGTPWEIATFGLLPPYIFEVTFQGEVHDEAMIIYLRASALVDAGVPGDPDADPPIPDIPPAPVSPPIITEHTTGYRGTEQMSASVAMEPDGDFVIAWTQYEETTGGAMANSNIYYRRFNETTDTAGPIVTDLVGPDGTLIDQGAAIPGTAGGMQHLVLVFDEEMMTVGPDSATNPEHFRLYARGTQIQGGIVNVEFGMSKAAELSGQIDPATGRPYDLNPVPTNKWEAVLTLDANGPEPGTPGLSEVGVEYAIEALAPVSATTTRARIPGLRDRAGNALGRTGFTPTGSDLTWSFGILGIFGLNEPGDPGPDAVDTNVNTTQPYGQSSPGVARNGDGKYVVAWVGDIPIVDPDPTVPLVHQTEIFGQMYDTFNRPAGNEFIINTVTEGDQAEPAVAIDAFGNFVVVWSGAGNTQLDNQGVFARQFDSNGNPLGGQFRVNDWSAGAQTEPSVAMDLDGDFVVTWSSDNQTGDPSDPGGVVGRRFNSLGVPQGDEFQVNATSANWQRMSDVAMDAEGNFVVVWASQGQDGNDWGVFGQRFDAQGGRLGGELLVNTYRMDEQLDPAVDMDFDGDFVVAWSSFGQKGYEYSVHARRFDGDGVAQGGEFHVNPTIGHSLRAPDVGLNYDGDFVVTWASNGHDDDPTDMGILRDAGVFAHMYNADGSEYLDPDGAPLGEFLVNAETNGNQREPAVARDATGHYVVAWTGPEALADPNNPTLPPNLTGIFSRLLDPPIEETPAVSSPIMDLVGTPGDDVFEFVAGPGPGYRTVTINGQVYYVDSEAVTFNFDGLGGNDLVLLTGDAGNESIEIWPGHGVLVGEDLSSDGYTVNFSNVESVTALGTSGHDEAIFHDSPGDDVFIGQPGSATMIHPDGVHFVTGFDSVVVRGSGEGYDLAKLYDSAGNDTYIAKPGDVTMEGDGFSNQVLAFDSVHGYAIRAGHDVAKLYDSPGDDVFIGKQIQGVITGEGFYNRAKRFEEVHAYAINGGYDVAKLVDTEGDDVFEADPIRGVLSGDDYYNRAEKFESVHAYAFNGGHDVAYLTGSDGKDIFKTSSIQGALYGDDYYNRAKFFEEVYADGTGSGVDRALMFDSAGDDHYEAWPTYAVLSGTNFRYQADNFGETHAYAKSGGVDVAELYGSSGNDTLVGKPIYTSLQGTVTGSNAGYYNRAKYFEKVHAYTEQDGIDTAILYDATLDTGLTERPIEGSAAESVKVLWMYEFEECLLAAESSNEDPVSHAVDSVMSAYWP